MENSDDKSEKAAPAGEQPPAKKAEAQQPQGSGTRAQERPERPAPQPQRQQRQSDRRPVTLDDIFGESMLRRAADVDSKLRANLVGSILFTLAAEGRGGSEKRFLFDWSTDALKCGPTDASTADCVIKTSESTLIRIASGDLNPQITMLSDRMRIDGRSSLAIYFFNLLAPGM